MFGGGTTWAVSSTSTEPRPEFLYPTGAGVSPVVVPGWPRTPIWWSGGSPLRHRTGCGWPMSPTSPRRRAGCTWPRSWTALPPRRVNQARPSVRRARRRSLDSTGRFGPPGSPHTEWLQTARHAATNTSSARTRRRSPCKTTGAGSSVDPMPWPADSAEGTERRTVPFVAAQEARPWRDLDPALVAGDGLLSLVQADRMTDQLVNDRLAGVEEGASIPGHGTSSVAVRIDRLSHLSEDIVRVDPPGHPDGAGAGLRRGHGDRSLPKAGARAP